MTKVNKTVYVVTMGGEEEVVSTIKEVKAILGDNKVTKKAIEAGEYPQVTISNSVDYEEVEDMEQATEALDSAGITEDADTNEVLTNTHEVEDSVEDEPTVDEPVAEDTTEDDSVEEEIEYPEVGYFEDERAIKRYIKKLSDGQLEEWCELEGVEWKHCEHPAINRMRMAMAIKAIHFPELAKPKAKKKKSKYADYSTEQLVQMALDNDVEVRDDKGDPRILRMYTIMALRDAGLLA